MSNFRAIATVTASLGSLLQGAATAAVPGATVTNVRPDATSTGLPDRGINVFLYQVTPNGSWRNADLPTRRGDSSVVQRPVMAVDLHYLLSFYGDDLQLEPQRLLGNAVSLLHARPVLSRDFIRGVIRAAVAADPGSFLAASDLAEQVELVKFAPFALNLEELSKLWSVFFQTPYALSIAYVGTVVLIEGSEMPQTALPVRERHIAVDAVRLPRIDSVQPATPAAGGVTIGTTISVRGENLSAEVVGLRMEEQFMFPTQVSDTELSFVLDVPVVNPALLRAGQTGLQVLHFALGEVPGSPRFLTASNVAPVTLRPVLTQVQVQNLHTLGGTQRAADLRLTLTPRVGKRQRLTVLLNEFNPPANRPAFVYRFEAPSRDVPAAPDSQAVVVVPVPQVHFGTYLLRVQVDGAESMLTTDSTPGSPTLGQYAEPAVALL